MMNDQSRCCTARSQGGLLELMMTTVANVQRWAIVTIGAILLAGRASAAERDMQLIAAARQNDPAAVRTLLKQGAAVNGHEADGP